MTSAAQKQVYQRSKLSKVRAPVDAAHISLRQLYKTYLYEETMTTYALYSVCLR